MITKSDIIGQSNSQAIGCQLDDYICISDNHCINRNLTCNGWNDCFDGSDEMRCPFTGMSIIQMDFCVF